MCMLYVHVCVFSRNTQYIHVFAGDKLHFKIDLSRPVFYVFRLVKYISVNEQHLNRFDGNVMLMYANLYTYVCMYLCTM